MHAERRQCRAGRRVQPDSREPGSSIPPEQLEQLTADIVAALEDRLRSGDPGRHLRAGPDLQDRRRRRPQRRRRHDADVARLPGRRRDADAGWRTRSPPCRASARSASSSPSTRPGTRTACPTRPSWRWGCSEAVRFPLNGCLRLHCRRSISPLVGGLQVSGAACDGFVQRGASAALQGRAATCLRISLLPIDLPEEAGKLGRKGTVEHMRGRGAKDVADRHQHEILDVFRFIR